MRCLSGWRGFRNADRIVHCLVYRAVGAAACVLLSYWRNNSDGSAVIWSRRRGILVLHSHRLIQMMDQLSGGAVGAAVCVLLSYWRNNSDGSAVAWCILVIALSSTDSSKGSAVWWSKRSGCLLISDRISCLLVGRCGIFMLHSLLADNPNKSAVWWCRRRGRLYSTL